jgi:hypothetical protein
MIYGTYYMHLAIQRALVSCLFFILKNNTKLNYYNPTQNVTSKTQLPSAVTIG